MSRNPHYIKMINSNKWKLLRAKKLQSNPVCEMCEANNRSTLATEVHHTVPVESVSHELGMRQQMFDYNNLQSLCHDCHINEHARRKSHSRKEVEQRAHKSTERFIKKFL